MKTATQRHALALAGLCLLTVYGCGGGGGGGGGSTPEPGAPAATTTSVPVTVIDDAIENATVCLDKNKNGACDAGEPFGKTDVAGKVTLQVANADVGKFPILAVVGTDAIDAAYGPVTTAFTMTAPADQTAVVSPLTTLVQTTVVSTGVTTAEAANLVQGQTGITVSLFGDFTKNATAAGKEAALLARTAVVVTQEQAKILAPALSASVTQANLDQIIQNKVLENLPRLIVVASTPAAQTATTAAAITAALTAPAVAIVTSPATGLTAASIPLLVAINNQNANPVVVVPTGVAAASLTTLNFADANTWFVRGLTSSIAQNTPDANNNLRFVDRRASSTPFNGAGAVASWNSGSTPSRQSDLHFTGTAWAVCGLNAANTASVRDAAGNGTFNYCNNLDTGKSSRAPFDVSGKTIASVITEARTAGYTNMSIGDNSPTALTAALSTAAGPVVFPTGSQIFYQTTTTLSTAPAYYPGLGNRVFQSNATLASGDTTACNASPQAAASEAGTLQGLIEVSTGTPCVFQPSTATVTTSLTPLMTAVVQSGTRNEGWGATTLSLGQIGTAPTGGIQTTYYTTNTPLRVSFAANNVARYYACQQRSTDGANRNCNLVGSGTYTIATLGDARVMSFTGLPVQAAALTFNRVFVERGGKVYFGYQNKPGVFNSARLNLAGGNALLTQLGIGSVDPETPLALTKASYAGDWQVSDPLFPLESTLIRIFNNGSTSCTETNATNPAAVVVSAPYACVVTFSNLAGGNLSLTNPAFPADSASGIFSFLTGAALGTFVDAGASGTFAGARR